MILQHLFEGLKKPALRAFGGCQGNRQLHGLFYFLAVSMVTVPKSGKPNQSIFYACFQRKISEGKTKSQALVCIMRRLVNIVYGIMKNKREYRPFTLENNATEE
ncbi:hypothetical protein ABFV83_12395 [Lacrimispora sp. BS-2]|uniref:Transposase n=1 Tax=Lacrimispora sp. BS-2 TaxID=3151850 RepID=A0AAU7PK78_9FIRM